MGLLDQPPPQGGLLGAGPGQGGLTGLLGNYIDWFNRGGLSGMLGMTPWDQQSMREQAMGMAAPGVLRGPYSKLPNSLMGFRRSGENVGFHEGNFPHQQYVRVTLDNGETFIDAIKGLNPKHAIERAYRNWEAKNVDPISREEAIRIDPALGER